MDIIHRKRTKNIILSKPTSVSVMAIAAAVEVGKYMFLGLIISRRFWGQFLQNKRLATFNRATRSISLSTRRIECRTRSRYLRVPQKLKFWADKSVDLMDIFPFRQSFKFRIFGSNNQAKLCIRLEPRYVEATYLSEYAHGQLSEKSRELLGTPRLSFEVVANKATRNSPHLFQLTH
ncbi:hypothetical protein TNCV_3642271 [Trichonephila clavipes]|nr:hypothetical protein TNCV_3642271 [Trichonephila clavipes]